jgi:hypothetical protein
MRKLHTSPRFGGSIDLYELVDTCDGEPLGATHIGTVVATEGGFTHGKTNARPFETQGAALVNLATIHYRGIPQHLLDAMPELMGADAFGSAMDKIAAAAKRAGAAQDAAAARWGSNPAPVVGRYVTGSSDNPLQGPASLN